MRALIKFVLKVVLVFLVLLILFGAYRTRQTENNQNERIYSAGKFPDEPLDGFYSLDIRDYSGIWKGKIFDAAAQKGTNVLHRYGKDEQRYGFKTSRAPGLREPELEVLQLDYNLPENPFWARPFLEEIVRIGGDEYLGKINYRFLPGFPFSLGHFFLKAQGAE